jgi:hypothetical protein
MNYWEKQIFPYLEGKWKFKWEIIQKCFYCSKDAIAICDSCSPTSSTGLTSEKPLCEDGIASILGINIVRWLLPKHEAVSKIEYAVRKAKKQKNKSLKNRSLRNNRNRGQINPLFYLTKLAF